MTAESFHRMAFAEAGPNEAGKLLEAIEPYLNFFIDPVEGHRMAFDATLRVTPECYTSRQSASGIYTQRTKSHVARDGNDGLGLFIPLMGEAMHMRLPERRHGWDEFVIRPDGRVPLKGNEEAFHAWSVGGVSQIICVPRAPVVAAVANLDDALYRGVERSAALTLLTGFAQTLSSDLGPMDEVMLDQATRTLTDLFVLALGPTRDGAEEVKSSVKTARLVRLKSDIEANLGNPDLSLDWLARRHSLRARGIQDLFYAAGEGFTEYVRGRRLDLAMRLLGDPRYAERNIAEIALASGFGDISWFNNAFRKRFGMTPSDARRAAILAARNGQE